MTDEAKVNRRGFLQSLPAWAGVGVLCFMMIQSFVAFDNRIAINEGDIKSMQKQIESKDVQLQAMSDRLKRIEDKLDRFFDTHN